MEDLFFEDWQKKTIEAKKKHQYLLTTINKNKALKQLPTLHKNSRAKYGY